MAGNLGRKQGQALQPILFYEAGKQQQQQRHWRELCRPRSPKLKYTQSVTHDATKLKNPGPQPAAPMP